jgi:hypothetical protein
MPLFFQKSFVLHFTNSYIYSRKSSIKEFRRFGSTGVWQKWRFSAPQTYMLLIKVWFSAQTTHLVLPRPTKPTLRKTKRTAFFHHIFVQFKNND